jgi:hypothetical protein
MSVTDRSLLRNPGLPPGTRPIDIDRVPGWSFVDVPAPRRPRPEPETELRGLPHTSNVQGLFRTADDAYLGCVVFDPRQGCYYAVGLGYGQLPGSHDSDAEAADALVDAAEIEQQDGERWDSCS